MEDFEERMAEADEDGVPYREQALLVPDVQEFEADRKCELRRERHRENFKTTMDEDVWR